ncbi:hypothetical protein ACFY2T_34800 [Streptomyces sp. NPDC001260]|uniref:hypothetical protein n=1 Tax=Streptomyces sp. NPDC001260 TaxID=3364551 RepID=UPI0036A6F4B0
MSALQENEDGVVVARLSRTYWLYAADSRGRRPDAQPSRTGSRRAVPAAVRPAPVSKWGRLRAVMLPVALLTVTAAVLVGVLT